MDKYALKKIIPLFAVVLVVLACELPAIPLPAVSNPAPAPAIPIDTIVVATAGAAQTQTAMVLPSATVTSTSTIPPTSTFTETPTATATVIFQIPTATKSPEPFVTESVGSNCQAVEQTPVNDTEFNPRETFTTIWKVKNTGNEYWYDTDVDFKFSKGTDMHKKDVLDMPVSVGPGSDVSLVVDMIAPKDSGAYTTTWTLWSKKATLCTLSIRIVIK
jgi:hypothetical protein